MKDILIFDTETTGLPPKGGNYATDFNEFPRIVQLSWTIGGEEKDFIIKPEGYVIPEESTAIHGITQERAMAEGVQFDIVVVQFIEDCKRARKVIGHNVYFDISIVKANILRLDSIFTEEYFISEVEPALDKMKRIDTMKSTIQFVNAKHKDGRGGKWPSLVELYHKLFQSDFPAHNSLEDVRATKACVIELEKLGVITTA